MKDIRNLKDSSDISIIYHNKDFDGIASGVLLKEYFPNAILHGYDHDQPIDFELKKNIIFADIGFKIPKMHELSKNHNITWIDHHISKYNEYLEFTKDSNDFLTLVYDVKNSACYGVYKWLYPNKDVTYSICLLSEYDIFTKDDINRWDNETLPFQFGLRAISNTVESFPIDVLYNKTLINDIINNGKLILQYQDTQNELLCIKNSSEITFQGYNVISLNVANGSFLTFKSIFNPEIHDMVMTYYFDGNIWHVSMYTNRDDIDCSEIARKNGGGGHRQAAGFGTHNINDIIS